MRYSIINFTTMEYSKSPVIVGGKLVVDTTGIGDYITKEQLNKVSKYSNGVIEAYSDTNNRTNNWLIYKKFRVFIPETHTLFNLPLIDHYVDQNPFDFNVDVKDYTLVTNKIIYSLISKEMKEALRNTSNT